MQNGRRRTRKTQTKTKTEPEPVSTEKDQAEMIHGIITILLAGVVLATLTQPNRPRLIAGVVFTSVTIIHEILLSDRNGYAYYASAALFDLGIIIILSLMRQITDLAIILQRVCVVSIVINLVGWLLWYLYLPPTAYNAAFVVLYLWAIIALTDRDRTNVGNYRDSIRSAPVFGDGCARRESIYGE